ARAPEPPAGLRVTPRSEGRFDVAVVAYDYFGEFAMLCGLLAVHGLEIDSGHVHTLAAPPPPPPGPSAAQPPPPGVADDRRRLPRAAAPRRPRRSRPRGRAAGPRGSR